MLELKSFQARGPFLVDYFTSFFKAFIFRIIFIVFFCITIYLVPLYPLSPTPITTLLSMSISLFSFFLNPSIPYCSPRLAVILFSIYESVSILLVSSVCSLFHMSEIIWYLSFSDWLMSLSMKFSMSIHTVSKGKIFFFTVSNIPSCKCPIVVLSTYLLMTVGLLPYLGNCK